MKSFFKIKSILGLFLALFYGSACLFDYMSIKEDSAEYIKVYNISIDSPYWKFRSVENFQLSCIIEMSICGIYIVLAVLYLTNKNNFLKFFLLSVEILVIIKIAISFYMWYASGFDH